MGSPSPVCEENAIVVYVEKSNVLGSENFPWKLSDRQLTWIADHYRMNIHGPTIHRGRQARGILCHERLVSPRQLIHTLPDRYLQ